MYWKCFTREQESSFEYEGWKYIGWKGNHPGIAMGKKGNIVRKVDSGMGKKICYVWKEEGKHAIFGRGEKRDKIKVKSKNTRKDGCGMVWQEVRRKYC